MKKFVSVLVLNLLLVSCATVTPNKIEDDKSSYDATTPKQYDKDNGGLISFIGDDALITNQARERYNNLITMYRVKFKKEKIAQSHFTCCFSRTPLINQRKNQRGASSAALPKRQHADADVCWRMLACADVC